MPKELYMCQDCGCSITDDAHNAHHHHGDETVHANPQLNDSNTIDVISKILHKNDHEAAHNREHFERNNILAINLMSSPGSGKTTLLEKLVDVADFKYSVIEGDLETSRDAQRLQNKGIQAYQIQTGSACHLDAFMVHKALHHIDVTHDDVCFIENVGNLVCPASYDVGAHLNIVLVSIPEGADKVAKYPVIFRKADLILFTKVDLLPHFEYDLEAEKKQARLLKPNVDILSVNLNDTKDVQTIAHYIRQKLSLR